MNYESYTVAAEQMKFDSIRLSVVRIGHGVVFRTENGLVNVTPSRHKIWYAIDKWNLYSEALLTLWTKCRFFSVFLLWNFWTCVTDFSAAFPASKNAPFFKIILSTALVPLIVVMRLHGNRLGVHEIRARWR